MYAVSTNQIANSLHILTIPINIFILLYSLVTELSIPVTFSAYKQIPVHFKSFKYTNGQIEEIMLSHLSES